MNDDIPIVPIDRIRIPNPRYRDKKKFELIIQSIKRLGLKKPIQVTCRSVKEDGEPVYDLVCGQGRIEAFIALGYREIPAIVVNVSKEDRLLRGLVENMARRFPLPGDLLKEIERLKAQGDSNVLIGKKLDIDDTFVGGFLALRKSGEERLLDAALSGKIPLRIAMEIARADTTESQRELLKAYEKKELTGASIRVVKRLIEQRRLIGKHKGGTGGSGPRTRTSAEGLVIAYKKESQRQRAMVQKAKICESKLVFVTEAFSTLMKDVRFVNLLREGGLADLPKVLAEKIDRKRSLA